MTSLAAQLPLTREAPPPVASEVKRYTALLGHILDDGKVTREEAEQLAVLARRAGLTQATAHGVHRQFLLDVRQRAEADGEVTNLELRELQRAAKNLDSRHMIQDLEEAAAADRQRRNGPLKGWRLLPIGEGPDVVSVMEMATSYGATAGVNVSKTTRMVIASDECDDPRVDKATDAGIPVATPVAARARLDEAIAQVADSSRGLLSSPEGERVAAELARDREEGPPKWNEYWRRKELDPTQCRGPFYPDGAGDDLEIVVDIPMRMDNRATSGSRSGSGCAGALTIFAATGAGMGGLIWTAIELLRHAVA